MRGNGLTAPAPLLDVPDRLGPLPRDKVFWCVGGFAVVPAAVSVASYFVPKTALLSNLAVLLAVWLVCIVLATLAAFFRPGGLNIAQWGEIVVDHVLRPKQTSWWR
jgi:hypothetical protein